MFLNYISSLIGQDCANYINDMYQELSHKEKFAPVKEELLKQDKKVGRLVCRGQWLVNLASKEKVFKNRIQYTIHFIRFSLENASLLFTTNESFVRFRPVLMTKCDECIRAGVDADLMNYYKDRFPKNFRQNRP